MEEVKAAVLSKVDFLMSDIVLYSLIFVIPLVVGNPQILVGTSVNMLLFLATYNLQKKQYLPLAMMPSVAAVFHGVLFGSFTMFLVYLLPFIWISNYVLMIVFTSVRSRLPAALAMLLAAIIKTSLLFVVAVTLYKFQLIPAMFLTVMGAFQLMTAILGGTLGLAVLQIPLFRDSSRRTH